MKKICILLLTFIMLQLSSFATNWVECGYKTWVDLDTVAISGKEVSAWFKMLNPGDWELFNGKKVGYRMLFWSAKVGSRQIGLKNIAIYDLKNKLLFSDDSQYVRYADIIPETVGAGIYNVLLEIYDDFKR